MARTVVRGVPLTLHPPPDYLSDTIRATGDFYEPDVLDELARRLDRPGGVLVDVGAMIGNHAAYLATFVPHRMVHAYEPSPVNVPLLVDNVGDMDTVRVHAIALSDRPGRLMMSQVDPANAGHAVVQDAYVWGRPPGPSWEAQARTLDAYALDDVRLIKVDVEGWEPQVLAGARGTIARWRPLIVLEDWGQGYAPLLPDYRLAVSWERAHQTYLYEPVP